MALKHTPQECAEEMIRRCKSKFNWVAGMRLAANSVLSQWHDADGEFGDEEFDAALKYAEANDLFTVQQDSIPKNFILTDRGAAIE
jgi:hypothetical protein